MKLKSAIYAVLLSGLLLPLMLNCKKEIMKTPPLLTISAITNITPTTANCGGDITSGGGAGITERGVCWSVNRDPTIGDNITNNGTRLGRFVCTVTGLAPGTSYFIKAYAINSAGTGYSNQSTFKTVALAPFLTTTKLSDITSTTATGGGNITNDGGSPIIARGICWSINQSPTITDSKTTSGEGSGSFAGSITGLIPGKTYYLRAFATNNIGIAYGNEVNITTTAILPVITTATVSSVTSTTATSGGNIISDGGAEVTMRGVCWSAIQNPTILDNKTLNEKGSGSFISLITGLKPGATYYIRAYATNSIGTNYGNQIITKINTILPEITTNIPSAITTTTAISGGNIISDGGATVTARGVCWSTSQTPTTINSKTTDGSGKGSYSSSLNGLTSNTTYYLRSYATNAIGTIYGAQISFMTWPTGNETVRDIDGNVYHIVIIGSQVWLVENMKTTRYRNGDPIPNVVDNTLWYNLITGAYCNYDNDVNNSTIYGRLYNWYAVNDSRNIAPTGWHVSTHDEWTT